MCHNCEEQKVENCFEIETPKCDEGCENITSTDCIFHNISNTDQSAKLFNIGVTKGSSLKYILKKIDSKLELLLTTDFSAFNLNGLEGEIRTIKEFSELITSELKKLRIINAENIETFEEIDKDLEDLDEILTDVVNINVSNSTLNITSTDKLKTVLNKILSYVEDINTSILTTDQFDNSESIALSVTQGIVRADVIVSPESGNILSIKEQGLYATSPSVTSLLKAIKDNPSLLNTFSALVNSVSEGLRFEIMSETNTPIKYINLQGVELVETAKANILLTLTGVKRVLTTPSSSLQITNKGYEL